MSEGVDVTPESTVLIVIKCGNDVVNTMYK